jgi:hypothetical protein
MMTRLALWLVTLVGLTAVVGFAPPASAQEQGSHYWAGATSQGEWLELTATPGPGAWTVSAVRLSGAVVKCARGSEDLDLSSLVFTTDTEIGSAPFTIGRLAASDAQVALVLRGQVTGDQQLEATVTVYWSRLYYAKVRDVVPLGERCSAVIPVTLQLFAVD